MKYRICWSDRPSVDEWCLEWGFPTPPLGKRAFVRIENESIPKLYAASKIIVKVATVKHIYKAILLDISADGLAMEISVQLEENQPLMVGFYLGTVKIISKAVVKHTKINGELYQAGIEFIDLNSEYAAYINGLYVSLVRSNTSENG